MADSREPSRSIESERPVALEALARRAAPARGSGVDRALAACLVGPSVGRGRFDLDQFRTSERGAACPLVLARERGDLADRGRFRHVRLSSDRELRGGRPHDQRPVIEEHRVPIVEHRDPTRGRPRVLGAPIVVSHDEAAIGRALGGEDRACHLVDPPRPTRGGLEVEQGVARFRPGPPPSRDGRQGPSWPWGHRPGVLHAHRPARPVRRRSSAPNTLRASSRPSASAQLPIIVAQPRGQS